MHWNALGYTGERCFGVRRGGMSWGAQGKDTLGLTVERCTLGERVM